MVFVEKVIFCADMKDNSDCTVISINLKLAIYNAVIKIYNTIIRNTLSLFISFNESWDDARLIELRLN